MKQIFLEPGSRFGKWTVLYDLRWAGDGTGDGHSLCVCDCGEVHEVRNAALRFGKTKSCGHFRDKNLSVDEAVKRIIEKRIRSGARLRGKNFELTQGQVLFLISRPCHWCGRVGVNSCKHPRSGQPPFRYNGLDRVNNDEGYTLANTVPCCGPCNRAKHTMTTEEFLDMCHSVAERHKLTGR
jgi:hypothetical protein